jgi:hypothetical protein
MKASEKISVALMRIRGIVKENKAHVIRSQQMRRADRELLVRTKWLQEIIKGWYLLVRPEDAAGARVIFLCLKRRLSMPWRHYSTV